MLPFRPFATERRVGSCCRVLQGIAGSIAGYCRVSLQGFCRVLQGSLQGLCTPFAHFCRTLQYPAKPCKTTLQHPAKRPCNTLQTTQERPKSVPILRRRHRRRRLLGRMLLHIPDQGNSTGDCFGLIWWAYAKRQELNLPSLSSITLNMHPN